MKSKLFILSFMDCAFGVVSKKSLPAFSILNVFFGKMGFVKIYSKQHIIFSCAPYLIYFVIERKTNT